MSADGRTLVTVESAPSGANEPAVAVAYDLPSLTVLGRRRVDIDGLGAAAGTVVVGVSGDRVLLRQIKYLPGMPSAAVWNRRTNSLRGTTAEALGLSGTGDVLYFVMTARPVPTASTDGGKSLPPFCLNVAPLADELPATESGYCSVNYALRQAATIAPDGSWVALIVGVDKGQTTYLERASDLRTGAWRPVSVNLPGPAYVAFWDTRQSFMAWVVVDDHSTDRAYSRCDLSGRCGPVTLPSGLHGASIVAPLASHR